MLRLFEQSLGPLEHLWSLGVEEHFYLVWPILFVAVTRRRQPLTQRLTLCVVGAILLATGWTWRLVAVGEGDDWQRMYSTIDTRATTLLGGCLLAVMIRRPWFARGLAWRAISAATGWAILLWVSTAPSITDFPSYWTVALPLAGLASMLVCGGHAASIGPPPEPLRWLGPLRALGRMSYGVYLWHYPVYLLIGEELTTMSAAEMVLATAVTVGIAAASFRWVERPWRAARAAVAISKR